MEVSKIGEGSLTVPSKGTNSGPNESPSMIVTLITSWFVVFEIFTLPEATVSSDISSPTKAKEASVIFTEPTSGVGIGKSDGMELLGVGFGFTDC